MDEIDVCEIPGKDDEYCKANKYCPDSKKKDRIFADVHNILHYVIKDDPQGDDPENPKSDPQYKEWEKSVIKYYEKEDDDIIFDDEPDECDKDDFDSYDAKISLSLPDTVDTNKITIKTSPETVYDIEKIEYYVDGDKIAETKDKNYEYSIPSGKNNKTITIEVRLTDKGGNTASAKEKVDIAFVQD
jgi:hypothetical protein